MYRVQYQLRTVYTIGYLELRVGTVVRGTELRKSKRRHFVTPVLLKGR
jgi:hypothetical protein